MKLFFYFNTIAGLVNVLVTVKVAEGLGIFSAYQLYCNIDIVRFGQHKKINGGHICAE